MTIQATPQQRSPLDLRQDLGKRLRILRISANLSGKELAERLGWDPSKVSRIEHAKTIPTPADVRSWCVQVNAEDQADDLAAQASTVEAAYTTWRSTQQTGMLHLQEASNDLFDRTRRLQGYESRVIPGLFQTRAYATVVLEKARVRRNSPDDVTAAAAARNRLRRVLDGPCTFAYVIEEHVLRSPVAQADVMRELAEQLTADSHRANVSLGIIPIGPRMRNGVENFAVYDGILVRTQLVGGRFAVNTPGDVAEYLRTFEELSSMAVHGDEARSLIRDALG
ncbi:Scr1 family TA system antitoxin-like transcriptional regulator [Actinomadura roseirufa]|uniref:Scr1 family TA system antitoxin-like transcriptional regulator n=1 Tax=Actinomadura roseirufa TaxID=2094049 RepID=UPI001040FF66|nr:Scr1 family TA system antitoxin-like transcriptional regulator [Actinomadura roseirufa]